MRLHEAKKLELDAKQAILVQEAICATLCMVTQSHIWHWQTKSYAAHTALGNYYEFLQGEVDTLAEVFMGAGGSFAFHDHKEIVNFTTTEDVQARLTNFKTELSDAETVLMSDDNKPLHGAGDIILDIIKETDKLLYLLTLE